MLHENFNYLIIINHCIAVKRITAHHGKPDIVRVVSELGLVLVSYPGLLLVQMVSLEPGPDSDTDKTDYMDLNRDRDHETGSVCDIVVREKVSIRGVVHPRVVMVAINTEPIDNRHYHIGLVTLYGLTNTRTVTAPLWTMEFGPVPIGVEVGQQARFYNQCIQKKGLSDFTSEHVVVVVGGCEGSAVLAVVATPTSRVTHKLQLRGDAVGGPGGGAADLEGGCEGGACQFSVVSLMIDKLHSHLCAVLLSTGHINVIDLYSGATLFQR